jgi:hypothetical protein
MLASHWRLLGVVLGIVLVLGGIVGWMAIVPRAQAADAKDAKLKALLRERLAVRQEVTSMTTKMFQSGAAPLEQVHAASQAAYSAELDLSETDKERIAVGERMLAEARKYENDVSRMAMAGTTDPSAPLKAKAGRLEVEIALERYRAK